MPEIRTLPIKRYRKKARQGDGLDHSRRKGLIYLPEDILDRTNGLKRSWMRLVLSLASTTIMMMCRMHSEFLAGWRMKSRVTAVGIDTGSFERRKFVMICSRVQKLTKKENICPRLQSTLLFRRTLIALRRGKVFCTCGLFLVRFSGRYCYRSWNTMLGRRDAMVQHGDDLQSYHYRGTGEGIVRMSR